MLALGQYASTESFWPTRQSDWRNHTRSCGLAATLRDQLRTKMTCASCLRLVPVPLVLDRMGNSDIVVLLYRPSGARETIYNNSAALRYRKLHDTLARACVENSRAATLGRVGRQLLRRLLRLPRQA